MCVYTVNRPVHRTFPVMRIPGRKVGQEKDLVTEHLPDGADLEQLARGPVGTGRSTFQAEEAVCPAHTLWQA